MLPSATQLSPHSFLSLSWILTELLRTHTTPLSSDSTPHLLPPRKNSNKTIYQFNVWAEEGGVQTTGLVWRMEDSM